MSSELETRIIDNLVFHPTIFSMVHARIFDFVANIMEILMAQNDHEKARNLFSKHDLIKSDVVKQVLIAPKILPFSEFNLF